MLITTFKTKMSEKLCLQWNEFQENVKSAFGNLRKDKNFADVTLVCEDGKQLEAHKVILAVSSPVFQMLLSRNSHPRPLIYMRKVKFVDMEAIVDFLYSGETQVFQENLDSFLAIADELQLKGLMGKTETLEELGENRKFDSKVATITTYRNEKKPRAKSNDTPILKSSVLEVKTVAFQNRNLNDEEVDRMVKSMMEKSRKKLPNGLQKSDVCKVCGMEGQSANIKAHIEANHLEGMTFPCNLCEMAPNSRKALKFHKQVHHG